MKIVSKQILVNSITTKYRGDADLERHYLIHGYLTSLSNPGDQWMWNRERLSQLSHEQLAAIYCELPPLPKAVQERLEKC